MTGMLDRPPHRILIAVSGIAFASWFANAATAEEQKDMAASAQAGRITATFEGIEFQYSPSREDLVRLLAHRFAEHNLAIAAAAAAPAKVGPPPPPLSADEMRLHRAEYLQHITALLGMTKPTELQQECYDAFLDNYTLYMGLYRTMRTAVAQLQTVRRVTVWDRAEMVRRLEAGEKIAGFTWDPVKKEGNVQFGISDLKLDDDQLKRLKERQKQLHREYRLSIASEKSGTVYRGRVKPKEAPKPDPAPKAKSAVTESAPDRSELFPVIIPPELAEKSSADQAEALWTQGRAPIGEILRFMSELSQRIPTPDPTLAFVVLHETTEIGIIDLYMRGPDRRWFCDGVANYVAWRVIRDLHGADIAKRAYDLPSQLERYAARREDADLRRWPAVENESADEQTSELDMARYAFATNAIVLMNQRAGEDVLPKLFATIGQTDARQVSIQTVAKAWTKLTGAPLTEIVLAAVYGQDAPPARGDSGLQQIAPPSVIDDTMPIGLHLRTTFSKKTSIVTSVKISAVDRDSPTERAGLKPGDLVVAIDGHPVTEVTVAEAKKLFVLPGNPGLTTPHVFRVRRGLFRKELDLTLELTMPAPPKGR